MHSSHRGAQAGPRAVLHALRPYALSVKISNPPKISPPSKIRPPPFLNEVVAKGAFLSKVRPPIYAAVHAVM